MCMYRSRVTLATIDAAAIAALFVSPSMTARCGGAVGPSLKPSTSETSAGWQAQSAARRLVDLLRVVQERERTNAMVAEAVVVEEHSCHHQRPCQGPAPGLVGAGD